MLIQQGKTNWKYILVVIVLAVIVGGGILVYQYWWMPKEEGKMPEIKAPADETANWKTYRNEEYGYEIKYPADFTAKDWAFKTGNWESLVYIGENKDIGHGAISIGIEKGAITFPYITKTKLEDLDNVLIGKDNYKAKIFSYKGPAPYGMPGESNFVKYFIERSGYLYQILYNKSGGLEESIFNQMLSTFKFLE